MVTTLLHWNLSFSKGLEFDIVILPFMSDKFMPTEEEIEKYGSKDDALSEEVKLIDVSVTRAKAGGLLTYFEELTELLPTDENLYDWRIGNDRI
ncbi:MAG: 3'-5' exonuclease [Clostridioides difficile]